LEEGETVEMQTHSAGPLDDAGLLPVSITMSILAVLIALVSLLGHRAHTHTILAQNRTGNEWVYYESKALARTNYAVLLDFLSFAQPKDPTNATRMKIAYQQKIDEDAREQKEIEASAQALEFEVAHEQKAADRFDLGEACLEAALVITSVTTLIKQRLYWLMGLALGCVGVVAAATGFFVK
jgi:hypothetical protein